MKIASQKKIKMTKPLFSDFTDVSAKQWKQKIQADLKGADYNDSLIWKTNDGLDVKPFYHLDEIDIPLYNNQERFDWNICQTIYVQDLKTSNSKAIDAINRGANSIYFIIPDLSVNLNKLMQNIDFKQVNIFIKTLFLEIDYLNSYEELFTNPNIHLHTDIIGNLYKTGNWYNSLEHDYQQFEVIIKKTNSISVDLSLYQNAGATIIQQLAYGLAQINEYFNHLDNTIAENKKATLKVIFHVSVGSNYFFEIAKLRALRTLYGALANEYGFNQNCLIFARPSKRNKTIYDYNTNLLRTTTECMSAILGGANFINNLPYDAIYHKNNEFGDRISRNQLLILKHESYFDKVRNPSDGTYYIEELTNQLAGKALDLFKEIEPKGGLLVALKNGNIQRKIKESATKEQFDFDNGKIVLLGTNKHPNYADKMSAELELYPFIKTYKRKTIIEPIIEKRLSEKTEQERLKTE